MKWDYFEYEDQLTRADMKALHVEIYEGNRQWSPRPDALARFTMRGRPISEAEAISMQRRIDK